MPLRRLSGTLEIFLPEFDIGDICCAGYIFRAFNHEVEIRWFLKNVSQQDTPGAV